ncbi:hypothetical protein PTTG_27755 [Puccinia triticina 1-1 BBBD Race 1]|uniref:Uncharacterized protein n=1 Tax=Puccinia triticina (isolate 1-1 / race 1 (BBBD)) TaxID=630390 RepID=A0A180GI70_PUCT1|nr:hypothetical protein PTTG_27755 [Puccinia triticina 1-1 BBBD Race 1]
MVDLNRVFPRAANSPIIARSTKDPLKIIAYSTNWPEPPPDWMLPGYNPQQSKPTELRTTSQEVGVQWTLHKKQHLVKETMTKNSYILWVSVRQDLLKAHCTVKASAAGIFDMRLGRYLTAEDDNVSGTYNASLGWYLTKKESKPRTRATHSKEIQSRRKVDIGRHNKKIPPVCFVPVNRTRGIRVPSPSSDGKYSSDLNKILSSNKETSAKDEGTSSEDEEIRKVADAPLVKDLPEAEIRVLFTKPTVTASPLSSTLVTLKKTAPSIPPSTSTHIVDHRFPGGEAKFLEDPLNVIELLLPSNPSKVTPSEIPPPVYTSTSDPVALKPPLVETAATSTSKVTKELLSIDPTHALAEKYQPLLPTSNADKPLINLTTNWSSEPLDKPFDAPKGKDPGNPIPVSQTLTSTQQSLATIKWPLLGTCTAPKDVNASKASSSSVLADALDLASTGNDGYLGPVLTPDDNPWCKDLSAPDLHFTLFPATHEDLPAPLSISKLLTARKPFLTSKISSADTGESPLAPPLSISADQLKAPTAPKPFPPTTPVNKVGLPAADKTALANKAEAQSVLEPSGPLNLNPADGGKSPLVPPLLISTNQLEAPTAPKPFPPSIPANEVGLPVTAKPASTDQTEINPADTGESPSPISANQPKAPTAPIVLPVTAQPALADKAKAQLVADTGESPPLLISANQLEAPTAAPKPFPSSTPANKVGLPAADKPASADKAEAQSVFEPSGPPNLNPADAGESPLVPPLSIAAEAQEVELDHSSPTIHDLKARVYSSS